MKETAEFVKSLDRVTDIELLPYHRLGIETYRKMGLEYELEGVETPSQEEMNLMADHLIRYEPGCPVKIKGKLYTGRQQDNQ